MNTLIKKSEQKRRIIKTETDCCAMCQISRLNDDTTIEEIETALNQLRYQAKQYNKPFIQNGFGQTCVFTVTSPGEHILREKLKQIGFKEVHQFKRRISYPQTGLNRLHVINLI